MGEAKRRMASDSEKTYRFDTNHCGGDASPKANAAPNHQSVHHLTLNTGHVRQSPRSEVAQDTIDYLLPMVAAGSGSFLGLDLGLGFVHPQTGDGVRIKGGAFFQIARKPGLPKDPFVMCFACWSEAISESTWEMCLQAYRAQANSLRKIGLWKEPPPRPKPPWLAVFLTPFIVDLRSRDELSLFGDLERCVFCALNDFEQGPVCRIK